MFLYHLLKKKIKIWASVSKIKVLNDGFGSQTPATKSCRNMYPKNN